MTDLRFILTAVALFSGAFVGISFGMPWFSKGQPVAARSMPAKLDVAAPASTSLPSSEQPAIAETRVVAPEPAAPPPPPTPPPARAEIKRDQLAQTALQAANAYARAPCDQMAKAAFIVAASTYLRAKDIGTDEARVHAAIKTAFETGHINNHDFPPDTIFSGRSSARAGKTGCVNSANLNR